MKGLKTGGKPRLDPPANAIEIIKKVATRGVSERTVASCLHISRDTWSRWKSDFPEIKEAYDSARAEEHDKLVGVLFDKAVNQGDSVAAMFLLKCRHNYRDGGITIEDNRSVKIGVMLPASLSQEQYKQIISTTAEVIGNE